MRPFLLLFIITILANACTSSEASDENPQAASLQDTTKIVYEISTKTAQKGNFPLKVITTGTLSAAQQLQITLPSSGEVAEYNLKVGQIIKKGELLTELDDTDLQYQLRQADLDLEKAIFEKNDMLVLQGGKEDQDTSVPAHKLKTIRTVSGYNRVQLNIEKLQRQVSQMKVYAPFDGIISEVNLQKGQQANAGTPICKIINYNTFEAVFNLTEQEAIQIRKGEQVTVSPIAQNNRTFSAKISTIQPVVSKDGLVEIRARLTKSNAQKLLEGMNLNIILQKNIPNQIIIPKSAVVLRSGREVVFTYDKKTQLAKWNYVTIAYQNDEQVAISKGIEANEEIIIKGQLNLEHDAEVVLINN